MLAAVGEGDMSWSMKDRSSSSGKADPIPVLGKTVAELKKDLKTVRAARTDGGVADGRTAWLKAGLPDPEETP